MNIQELTFDNLNEALPTEVMTLINDTAIINSIFPVNIGEIFNGQILKANEIIFQPNATLTFTNINVPFWIIYCDKLKLKDNNFPIRIELDQTIEGRKGKDGIGGINGVNGVGEIDRQGQPGSVGQSGLIGEQGDSLNNPNLYIITKEMVCIDTQQNIEDSRIVLDFDGISGGDGGNGGSGGNGGNGSNGKEGADSLFDCKEGAGNGGGGANSGQGGKGGQGGNGSNGSSIYFISVDTYTEVLVNTTKFYIRGGNGGIGGNGGKAGKPGYGGRGGGKNGWCGRGVDADDGNYPEPRTLGNGLDGQDGEKGQVFKVIVKNF
ncbi:hypothetical protein IM793_14780 [Pedobacter sp. MR2016-19]|uniref:hypothetical protein n=1 Tax=Pedobacter sp. MR2016-19 TaxID=2780089 RepID=UPI0018734C36|nr:hypothetical protein [Pedobacter sp. MR2016-19]MBE5320428.1 hypothetical protein [Pedobacter sp. MR2016-19]